MASTTINSSYVVKGLFAKATLLADLYRAFYNIIVNGVTDPSITSKTKFVYGQYPDNFINGNPSKDLYPFIVINPPRISWEPWLFKKKIAPGTITIEVISSKNKVADTLMDSVISSIESQIDELWGNKLRNVLLESIDPDHAMRGKISIHSRAARFSFKYTFSSTI